MKRIPSIVEDETPFILAEMAQETPDEQVKTMHEWQRIAEQTYDNIWENLDDMFHQINNLHNICKLIFDMSEYIPEAETAAAEIHKLAVEFNFIFWNEPARATFMDQFPELI